MPEDAWTASRYPGATRDEETGQLIFNAEVAEIPYVLFTSTKGNAVPGRLVVRRIPELSSKAECENPTLFDMWRFHAFFTTADKADLDTVASDRTHRHHAIIEQVIADSKTSALAHLPSGKHAEGAAWLVLAVIAYDLTRAAGVIADSHRKLSRAVTATIRRVLINVPARIASSARRLCLHLPESWPWERAWPALLQRVTSPPKRTAV